MASPGGVPAGGMYGTQEPNVRRAMMDLERRATRADAQVTIVRNNVTNLTEITNNHTTEITNIDNSVTEITNNFNSITVVEGNLIKIDGEQLADGTVTAAALAVDAVMSNNYQPPGTGEVFSQAGSFFDLAEGDLVTPGLFVDGESGDVSIRGDITASAFTALDPDGSGVTAATLAAQSFVGPILGDAFALRMHTNNANAWRMGRIEWTRSENGLVDKNRFASPTWVGYGEAFLDLTAGGATGNSVTLRPDEDKATEITAWTGSGERVRIDGGTASRIDVRADGIVGIDATTISLDGDVEASDTVRARRVEAVGTGPNTRLYTRRTDGEGWAFAPSPSHSVHVVHDGTGILGSFRYSGINRGFYVGPHTAATNTDVGHSLEERGRQVTVGTENHPNLYLGRPTNGAHNAGQRFIEFRRLNSGNLIGSVEIATTSSVTYNTTSDRRLKTDLGPLSDPGEIIDQLDVRRYCRKHVSPDDDDVVEEVEHGLYAQDVFPVYPEAVSPGGEDPQQEPWQLDYSKFVPLLLGEVKALRARLAELEAA